LTVITGLLCALSAALIFTWNIQEILAQQRA
jgi:hypothetical protein